MPSPPCTSNEAPPLSSSTLVDMASWFAMSSSGSMAHRGSPSRASSVAQFLRQNYTNKCIRYCTEHISMLWTLAGLGTLVTSCRVARETASVQFIWIVWRSWSDLMRPSPWEILVHEPSTHAPWASGISRSVKASTWHRAEAVPQKSICMDRFVRRQVRSNMI